MSEPHPHAGVGRWLAFVYVSILFMVVIGGITRLTGSGLSMVEWRPLMGAVPPMGDAAWQEVFDKYKGFPQYQLVNEWMELADFKRIFFWEYLHRLWGRALGLIFALPFAWFLARGRLRGITLRTLVAFLLGGAQGLLGWYMVKSGLVDHPEVSHLRLAAHLMLALVAANYVLWQALYVGRGEGRREQSEGEARARSGAWGLTLIVAVQVVYGAFMAGTKAGHIFSSFPTMNGSWFPVGSFGLDGPVASALHNPVAIHAIHRTLAWGVLLSVAMFSWRHRFAPVDAAQRRAMGLLAWSVILQIALGAATVMTSVGLVWAVSHQLVGALMLSATVYAAWAFSGHEVAG